MSEISNKKRKFIERTFKQLSIEELASKTGLKPQVIRSIINEYSTEMQGEDQSAHIKNRVGIFLSWKIILLTSLLLDGKRIGEGDKVEFEVENSGKGLKAVKVRVLE